MSAPGKLVRSSRWKTGPSKGQRPLGSECCVTPGDSGHESEREVQNETSPPTISTSGSRCCRAAGRGARRLGASLSDADSHVRFFAFRFNGFDTRPRYGLTVSVPVCSRSGIYLIGFRACTSLIANRSAVSGANPTTFAHFETYRF
jgi:hypothetical protein